jgi:hypothetical protein
MLVQGDALTTLQTMESDLKAQIAATTPASAASRTKDDTIRAATEKVQAKVDENKRETTRGLEAAKASVNAAKGAIYETKRETTRGVSQTAASGRGIEAAIARNRPITNVRVNVSATTVKQVTEVTTRYGSSSGSRNSNNSDLGRGGQ